MPARAAASFTTSQRTFGVIPSPQILPALLIARNTRPVVMCADSVQKSKVLFTQRGIGTVRIYEYSHPCLSGSAGRSMDPDFQTPCDINDQFFSCCMVLARP